MDPNAAVLLDVNDRSMYHGISPSNQSRPGRLLQTHHCRSFDYVREASSRRLRPMKPGLPPRAQLLPCYRQQWPQSPCDQSSGAPQLAWSRRVHLRRVRASTAIFCFHVALTVVAVARPTFCRSLWSSLESPGMLASSGRLKWIWTSCSAIVILLLRLLRVTSTDSNNLRNPTKLNLGSKANRAALSARVHGF